MKNSSYKHAAILPLVGGMAYGASKALGSDPLYSISWPAFAKNESTFKKNFTKTDHHTLEKEELNASKIITPYDKVDIVHAVPVCAGLSNLSASNPNTRAELKVGSDAHQNRWMHHTVDVTLGQIKPDVLIFENAQGLSQGRGKDMRGYLKKKALDYGYALSFYLTNSLLHGLPQNRTRSFAFFWRGNEAPKFNWYNRDKQLFEDYIKISKEDQQTPEHKIFAYKKPLQEDPFMKFMLHKFGNDWRGLLKKEKRSLISMGLFLRENKLFDEALSWSKGKEPQLHRIVSHWKKKLDAGLGYWDSSPLFFNGHTNAIISKNTAVIHPHEDRWLSVREMMHMMGLPGSYSLDIKDGSIVGGWNIVCQNVTVGSAMDMTSFAKDWLDGKTESSGQRFLLGNNMTQTFKIED